VYNQFLVDYELLTLPLKAIGDQIKISFGQTSKIEFSDVLFSKKYLSQGILFNF
jgi:hypothetical protein